MAKKNTWLFIGAGLAVGLLFISAKSGSSVSQAQIDQTKQFESFSATAYADGSDANGNQLYSIGYGHQIQPNETYLLTATITEAQASQFLVNDMGTVTDYIANQGITLTQGQLDAMADFGYNEGLAALGSLIKTFNASGADAVPALMNQYIYWHPVPGGAAQVNQSLVNRRAANVAAWNS